MLAQLSLADVAPCVENVPIVLLYSRSVDAVLTAPVIVNVSISLPTVIPNLVVLDVPVELLPDKSDDMLTNPPPNTKPLSVVTFPPSDRYCVSAVYPVSVEPLIIPALTP